MRYLNLIMFGLAIVGASSLHATIHESKFEKTGRINLQKWTDELAAVENYLDMRLKGQQTYIQHPETQDGETASILDGFYLQGYSKIPLLKDHNAFSQQKKYSSGQVGKYALKLSQQVKHDTRHKAVLDKYESLSNVDGHLKLFFRKTVSYKKVNFSDKSQENYDQYDMGSTRHAQMIHLAAHEVWKKSVICYLKFSVFLHNYLGEEGLPDFLASSKYGFLAHRYSILRAQPENGGKYHTLTGTLHFSLPKKGETYTRALDFLYDTGATITSIPFTRLQEAIGLVKSDLIWDQETQTANGSGTSAKLYIHYLQLDPYVVFRDREIYVSLKGTSCLLGTDISKQFLQERRRGNEKLMWVKQNNWKKL